MAKKSQKKMKKMVASFASGYLFTFCRGKGLPGKRFSLSKGEFLELEIKSKVLRVSAI
jgi:hypothetical protein